jgi:hypothetical protein
MVDEALCFMFGVGAAGGVSVSVRRVLLAETGSMPSHDVWKEGWP